MAGLSIRISVSPHTKATLVECLTRIIADYRDTCGREGIVPALLAEDAVDRLTARQDVVLLGDEDESGG